MSNNIFVDLHFELLKFPMGKKCTYKLW